MPDSEAYDSDTDRSGGDFIVSWGAHKDKPLAYCDPDWMKWSLGEAGVCQNYPEFIEPATQYLRYLSRNPGVCIVPFGKKHRGKRLEQCRDLPWIQWCCTWAAEKHPAWVECAVHWLQVRPKRKEMVKRDVGEPLTWRDDVYTLEDEDDEYIPPSRSQSSNQSESDAASVADDDAVIVFDDGGDDEDEDEEGSRLDPKEYKEDAGEADEELAKEREADEQDIYGNLKGFVVSDGEGEDTDDDGEKDETAEQTQVKQEVKDESEDDHPRSPARTNSRATSQSGSDSDEGSSPESGSDSDASSAPTFASVLSSHSTRASSISSDSNTDSESEPRRSSPYLTRNSQSQRGSASTSGRRLRGRGHRTPTPDPSDDVDEEPAALRTPPRTRRKRLIRHGGNARPASEDEDEAEEAAPLRTSPRTPRKPRIRARAALQSGSDVDEDEKPRRRPPARKRSRVVPDSDTSDGGAAAALPTPRKTPRKRKAIDAPESDGSCNESDFTPEPPDQLLARFLSQKQSARLPESPRRAARPMTPTSLPRKRDRPRQERSEDESVPDEYSNTRRDESSAEDAESSASRRGPPETRSHAHRAEAGLLLFSPFVEINSRRRVLRRDSTPIEPSTSARQQPPVASRTRSRASRITEVIALSPSPAVEVVVDRRMAKRHRSDSGEGFDYALALLAKKSKSKAPARAQRLFMSHILLPPIPRHAVKRSRSVSLGDSSRPSVASGIGDCPARTCHSSKHRRRLNAESRTTMKNGCRRLGLQDCDE